MLITKCEKCGCTRMAEDRVADLERHLQERQQQQANSLEKFVAVANQRDDLERQLREAQATFRNTDCLAGEGDGRLGDGTDCQRSRDPSCLNHWAQRTADERDEVQAKLWESEAEREEMRAFLSKERYHSPDKCPIIRDYDFPGGSRCQKCTDALSSPGSGLRDALRQGHEALAMLWDYNGHSFELEEKRFSVADFEDRWGYVEEAEKEWGEKIPAALKASEPYIGGRDAQ